jgi:hypothetical protein
MGALSPAVIELVRDARAVLRDAKRRRPLTEAWESLQERGADGRPNGARPYTPDALRSFQRGALEDPSDVRIAHHLAIAHHALAWDLELAGDTRAAEEWARALGYWRGVTASREFWEDLEYKLACLDQNAIALGIAELRRDLIERLLEIHVDFIRHYSEAGTPDRARAHVAIVRRAQISPAAKKRLVARVFDDLTSAVPEARQKREFESALVLVERFLELFEDHLPALRLYLELAGALISSLGFRSHWAEIERLAARSLPRAERLAAHPEQGEEPLATAALIGFASEVSDRAQSRTRTELAREPFPDKYVVKTCCEFALLWAGMVWRRTPLGSGARFDFCFCAYERAKQINDEVNEILGSRSVPWAIRRDAALDQLREAYGLVSLAAEALPDEEAILHARTELSRSIIELEAELP